MKDDRRPVNGERVSQLVAGFETPFGLELLSTVHWILERDQASSDDELVERTYACSERKRRFSPEQLHLAARTLRDKGWIHT